MKTTSEAPLITVVTPNFNYGSFIEQAITSILDQGYPNLQYIIIDGGSTDNSVAIIERYSQYIDYWHSKHDTGQADAINQGLRLAKGQIVNWINSDDQLSPGALSHIAECYRDNPNSLIAGSVINSGPSTTSTTEIVKQCNLSVKEIIEGKAVFHQPGIWWNTSNLKKLGYLDTTFHYCFDYLLLLRYLSRWPQVVYSNNTIANFTLHQTSKTTTSQPDFDRERRDALRLLADHEDFKPFRDTVKKRLKILAWHEQVSDILSSPSSQRFIQALQILGMSLMDPATRLNRFSAGAIKNSMISRRS